MATTDDPTNAPRRRRGDALLQAIYDSVLAELAEVGLGRLTMEGIAARAGTGKMPLYRRWASPHDLLLEAVRNLLATVAPNDGALPDTGSLREDLMILLNHPRDVMAGPVGPAISAVISERHRYPALIGAISNRIFGTHTRIEAVLRRAAERGEIDAERITPHVCLAGPALLILCYLVEGKPPARTEMNAIIDSVVLPALGVVPD
ncbi:TetR/AcrR family transcriptional regulator [Phytohabitans aurantiacus]|jgi:AcrR family transcriptional regulator|uniref:TetR family transcriptional regulator n=1 Tax=Phytohabitans aurantiacus TaxID=3016789 RepID=A0ABQ5QYH9_9ACTN|nr:TetR/AcrR family transcriptional regulator [Phytohabitans aurantiacus]GLH99317.1 TetR family transcriptional regulator [Phytohabitans aurantiacus]